jgi:hypothetical protein
MHATYCYANGLKSRTAGGPATPAAILSRHRRYRHAPCRDFPCLMRLWPGSPTATARPGRACCRASSGSAVRLIEASAPLRERASAGISDPYEAAYVRSRTAGVMKTLMRNGRDRRTRCGPSRGKNACSCLGPISGSHQGQRPQRLHRTEASLQAKTGRIHGCTRTLRKKSDFSLAPRAPSIHGPNRRFTAAQ